MGQRGLKIFFIVYYYNKKVKRSNEITEPTRSDHWKPEERDIYESLCRGETDQPEGLICYYHHGKPDNYYLQLGPVKTEELFKAPYVVRFLEVYSGNWSKLPVINDDSS